MPHTLTSGCITRIIMLIQHVLSLQSWMGEEEYAKRLYDAFHWNRSQDTPYHPQPSGQEERAGGGRFSLDPLDCCPTPHHVAEFSHKVMMEQRWGRMTCSSCNTTLHLQFKPKSGKPFVPNSRQAYEIAQREERARLQAEEQRGDGGTSNSSSRVVFNY